MYLRVDPYHSVMQQLEELQLHPEFLFKLTGVAGTGKTSLLKQFCSTSEENGFATEFFPNCPRSPAELRKLIRSRFSLPKSHNLIRVLERQLQAGKEYTKGVVLLFDDCHLMSTETLLDLETLTEIKVSKERMLNIVFCGTPTLNKRLARNPALHGLLQRFTGSVELPLLDRNTLPLYIYRYFETHEKTPLEFEKAALSSILKLSKGRPDIVTYICRKLAESQAGLMTSTPVTKAEIATLAHYYFPDAGGSWFSENRILLAGSATAVILLIVGFLGLQGWRDSSRPAPIAVTATTNANTSAPPSVFVDNTPTQTPAEAAVTETTNVGEPNLTEVPDITLQNPSVTQATDIATADAPATILAAAPVAVDTPVFEEPVVVEAADPIELAVFAWGDAWANQDMDTYFGSYHTQFEPSGFSSLSAWRSDRQRNIADREGIGIDITEFRIISSDAQNAEVNFWLHYESPGYSDDTLKMMNLVREGERWLIMTEINLEVRQR